MSTTCSVFSIFWDFESNLKFENAYTGPSYDKNKILYLLKKYKIKFTPYCKKFIAKQISIGKVIGRCSGRGEYGPRALGNRSIIANPLVKDIKNILNRKIKFEWFESVCVVCVMIWNSYLRTDMIEYGNIIN